MEIKTQSNVNTYVGVFSLLLSVILAFFTFFVRSQDRGEEMYEKEAKYRAKTTKDMQDIKDLHKNELQTHENRFQEHLLKNQRTILDILSNIKALQISNDNLRRQNEYLHSQVKLENEAIRAECENKYRKK